MNKGDGALALMGTSAKEENESRVRALERTGCGAGRSVTQIIGEVLSP